MKISEIRLVRSDILATRAIHRRLSKGQRAAKKGQEGILNSLEISLLWPLGVVFAPTSVIGMWVHFQLVL